MAEEEDVTIIDIGGRTALGVITNLVCSGYAKFGNRGTLFSPDGDQQVSGTLVTYNNLIGRGGLFAGDLAGTNYVRGSFLRGNQPSGDPVIDGSGFDYALLGSGFIRGPVRFQDPQVTDPPTATVAVEMPLLTPQLIVGVGNSGDTFGPNVLSVAGSGLITGPLLVDPRSDFPTDSARFNLPVYLSNAATPPSDARILSSGELAAHLSYALDAQTNIVTVENTGNGAVYTHAVPSDTLGTHGAVEVEWFGHYLNNTGAPQMFGVSVSYGGTLWATGTVSGVLSSAGARALSGRARFTAAGSATAQRAQLAHQLDVPHTASGTGTSASAGAFSVAVTNPYVTVDSEASADVLIQFIHSATDPSLRASVYSVIMRKL